jgi:hypothetical protein
LRAHDREGVDCGNELLNNEAKTYYERFGFVSRTIRCCYSCRCGRSGKRWRAANDVPGLDCTCQTVAFNQDLEKRPRKCGMAMGPFDQPSPPQTSAAERLFLVRPTHLRLTVKFPAKRQDLACPISSLSDFYIFRDHGIVRTGLRYDRERQNIPVPLWLHQKVIQGTRF